MGPDTPVAIKDPLFRVGETAPLTKFNCIA